MKLSEQIAIMQAMIKAHGDLDTMSLARGAELVSAKPPKIAYRIKGNGSRFMFLEGIQDESLRGKPFACL